MEMKLILHLTGVGVDPLTAAGDDDRRGPEQCFELLARLVGMRIALDRERESVRHIDGASSPTIVEGRDRWAERHRLVSVTAAPREVRRGHYYRSCRHCDPLAEAGPGRVPTVRMPPEGAQRDEGLGIGAWE
jgi:hypothetical protein